MLGAASSATPPFQPVLPSAPGERLQWGNAGGAISALAMLR